MELFCDSVKGAAIDKWVQLAEGDKQVRPRVEPLQLPSSRSRRASDENHLVHSAATSSVPIPPTTTEPTGQSKAAAAPESNSPSSLLAPINSELTALTRPRISSGVSVHADVVQNLADPCPLRDERDEAHRPTAQGAHQRENLVAACAQNRPRIARR